MKKAYNCRTLMDAKNFLHMLHNKGVRWSTGDKLLAFTLWENNKEETCYKINENGRLTYADANWYRRRGYEIIVVSSLSIRELLEKRGIT